MNEKVRWNFLLHDTRARVYLMWAVITASGFIATHYNQRKEINAAWFVLSLLGLGYMFKVMPLRIRQMRLIFLSWLVPIAFGMVMSFLSFRVESLLELTAYLGAFWLAVMAVGYFLNGLVDPPSLWYWFAVVLNLAAALLCWKVDAFILNQYIIAAVVSAWSMLYLWILRT